MGKTRGTAGHQGGGAELPPRPPTPGRGVGLFGQTWLRILREPGQMTQPLWGVRVPPGTAPSRLCSRPNRQCLLGSGTQRCSKDGHTVCANTRVGSQASPGSVTVRPPRKAAREPTDRARGPVVRPAREWTRHGLGPNPSPPTPQAALRSCTQPASVGRPCSLRGALPLYPYSNPVYFPSITWFSPFLQNRSALPAETRASVCIYSIPINPALTSGPSTQPRDAAAFPFHRAY